METITHDAFSRACRRLQELDELRTKDLLEDAEWRELRASVVAQLKRAATTDAPGAAPDGPRAGSWPARIETTPFAQLHAGTVDALARRGGEEPAPIERVLRAVGVLSEARVLGPGEGDALARLAEAALAPMDAADPNMAAEQRLAVLLDTVRQVDTAAASVAARPQGSVTATAIAETTRESVTRAAAEYAREPKKPDAPRSALREFWRKLVMPDVLGAFEGGSAAAGAAAAFGVAAPAFPIAAPVAAALGVVVGAGLRSADAWAERKRS